MSTLQNVLDALTLAIRPAVPAGITSLVYSGWPTQQDLESDSGSAYPLNTTVHVNVYPMPGGKLTTRFARTPVSVTPAINLSVITSGNALTFAGTLATGAGGADVGAVVGVTIQKFPPVRYTVVLGDTTSSIATGVTAAINAAGYAGVAATPSGASLSVTKGPVACNVGGLSVVQTLIRQQEQEFMVTVWASSPSQRDTVADAIDLALGALNRLTLADFPARIMYERTWEEEPQFNVPAFRRSLFYNIEWSLTQSDAATAIVAPTLTVSKLP